MLGPSYDQLGPQRWILESTSEANAAEGVFGVLGRRILRPRVAQETPRVENSDEKTAQRGPRDIPKEGQIVKPRKLQHLDFERPYKGLATFTPFGETGRGTKSC